MKRSTLQTARGRYFRIPTAIAFLAVFFSAATTWAAGRAPLHVGLPDAARAGLHGLDIDQRALDEWAAGEVGELSLPGGRAYPVRGEHRELHASGNRSWVGRIDQGGRQHLAILTYGPAGVVGEIRTPDGLFLIETVDGRPIMIDTEQAGWAPPRPTESDALVPDSAAPPPATTTSVTSAGSGALTTKATEAQTTIDVLIAYSSGMVTRAGSTAGVMLRLNQLFATSNQAYIDSQVSITLRMAHAVEVAYTDGNDNSVALSDLTNGTGVLASAKTTLRDRYGADIVVLVRPFNYPAQVGCGVAWIGGYNGNGASIGNQAGNGFAVVSDGSDINNTGYYCQNATFPHELGHNMGALHDRQTVTQGGTQALQVGAYSYSYGYVHSATFSGGSNNCIAGSGTSCFGTIMSYLNKTSELKFSNPSVTCPGGFACGTTGDNVALTLNNTKAGVAGWRPTKVPFTAASSGSGQNTGLGQGFPLPLQLTVRDATGAVVPGVMVNFAAPATGASATLSAASVVTDANGLAQVTAVANGTSGSYVVTATPTSGLVSAPVSFSLSNGSGTMLTVVVNGGGSVTGSGISCPGDCTTAASGSAISLSAVPASGKVFTGWLGGGCTGTSSCTVSAATATTVSATFGPSTIVPIRIDIDQDGRFNPLTDGVLIARFMNGLTGTALTSGAVGSGALRPDPATLLDFLSTIAPALDVDGNGKTESATDGLLIVRYLLGLRGAALTQGAIGAGATRTAAQIASYLATLLP